MTRISEASDGKAALSTGRSKERLYDRAMIGVVAVFACVYVLTTATVESFGSDTSTYYSLAKSLLDQHRYWFNFEPHTFYPPGFPVLLAGLISIAGDSFGALVKCLVGIYFVGAIGLYYFLKRRSDPATAFAILAIVVTSYVFYFLATVGMHSDGPYFAVSAFALLWFDIGNTTADVTRRRRSLVVVGLLAAYLLLVRSIGITFVGALVVWMLAPDRLVRSRGKDLPSQRIKQWAPAAAFAIAVFAGWSSWAGHHQPRGAVNDYANSYSRQILKQDPHRLDSPAITIRTLPGRIVAMAITRTQNATRMVLNLPGLSLKKSAPLMLGLSLLVGIGVLASIVEVGALLDWYVLLYSGVLLLYPYDEGMRYLYPIQPFLILYAANGATIVYRALQRRLPLLAPAPQRFAALQAAACLIVILAGLFQVSVLVRRNRQPDVTAFTNAATVQASRWIVQNSRPGDVVMDDQDSIMCRLTGRKTFHFPLTTDPALLRETIAVDGVKFVVVPDPREYEYYDPSPANRFERLTHLSPDLCVPVYRFRGGTIYRVRNAQMASTGN